MLCMYVYIYAWICIHLTIVMINVYIYMGIHMHTYIYIHIANVYRTYYMILYVFMCIYIYLYLYYTYTVYVADAEHIQSCALCKSTPGPHPDSGGFRESGSTLEGFMTLAVLKIQLKAMLPSDKLTELWKITIFNGKTIYGKSNMKSNIDS